MGALSYSRQGTHPTSTDHLEDHVSTTPTEESTAAEAAAAARAALEQTPTRELLTKAYHLTHRMVKAYDPHKVRLQRELISDELVRRATLHDMALPNPELPGLTHTKRDRLEQELWLAAEVEAGRACGLHDRPQPCQECRA